MPFDEGLSAFIEGSFRSVWSVELLCFLLDHPSIATQEEIVIALRVSHSIIRHSSRDLRTAGLVMLHEGERIVYQPVSEELAQLALATRALYLSSPHAVRRLIAKAANPGISAFADAFRFKGD